MKTETMTPKDLSFRVLVALEYEDREGVLHTCSIPLGSDFPLVAITRQLEWVLPSLPEGATLKSFAYPEIKYTYVNVAGFAESNPPLYEAALKAAELVRQGA